MCTSFNHNPQGCITGTRYLPPYIGAVLWYLYAYPECVSVIKQDLTSVEIARYRYMVLWEGFTDMQLPDGMGPGMKVGPND